MTPSNQQRILVIGAGLTGSLITNQIAKNSELRDRCQVSIWEKAKEVGGRCSSFLSADGKRSVDMGAQYLTRTTGNQMSNQYFQELLEKELLRPLDTTDIQGFRHDDTKLHYACSKGMGAVVKYFLNEASPSVILNQEVTALKILKTKKKNMIQAYCKSKSMSDSFDIVISTTPVPQLLQLTNFNDFLTESLKENSSVEQNLKSVEYTSRYAVGLFFDSPLNFTPSQQPITFIQDRTSPICYWAIEDYKRTGKIDLAPLSPIVMHTCTEETDSEIIPSQISDGSSFEQSLLLEARRHLPQQLTDSYHPRVILHHWKYSQVSRSYPKSPGFVVISKSPLLIATGDAFSCSTFEGCIEAARKTVAHLSQLVQIQST